LFERVVLRKSEGGTALSLGDLCEAMLFYEHVHVILDHGSLIGFARSIGLPQLLLLLGRPRVSATYAGEFLGTHTETNGSMQVHRYLAFAFAGSEETGVVRGHKKRLQALLIREGYKKKQAALLAERFKLKAAFRKLSDDRYVPGGILAAARHDLFDAIFINKAVRQVLHAQLPEPLRPSEPRFDIVPIDHESFGVSTSINFKIINAHLGNERSISPASVLTDILNARADVALASYYGGDFHTSALSSAIIRLRYGELLLRAGINAQEAREMREIVVSDAPSIREVMDSKERTLDEFLVLLERAQKFRTWIHGLGPDEKLVQAYFREVTAQGWISKLPTKIVRYVIATAVGVVEPALGAAISAADSLLLDKLLTGWRPSHFVERHLRPFVDSQA
jgi:hypothetical protein